MKKIFLAVFILVLMFGGFSAVFGQEQEKEKIEINFFHTPACPVCIKAKSFFDELEKEDFLVSVREFNLFEKENVEQIREFYRIYKVPLPEQGRVPIIFIKDRYFLGFNQDIAAAMKSYLLGLNDLELTDEPLVSERKISLPIFGEIDLLDLSPLWLSIILGTLDGFNACAMFALIVLLTFLIPTKSKKRIFLIGGTFILVSGAVYFLFISAWLNLFLFLEHIRLISSLVGVIVIVFSIFLLKDYFSGKLCRVCQIAGKQSILAKFQERAFKKMEKLSSVKGPIILSLLGVAVVAAGINMVELFCTLGFPMIFTKILTALNLSAASYYFYIFIYILFYMLDDFLVFSLAVLTMKIIGASEKYLKFVKLVSGILLLILGLIILIKPEILVFG